MITLYIDSSKKSLSVAIASGNKLLFVSNTPTYNKHSNFLMNTIIKAIEDQNLTIYDIDNIVVLNGPGSFTGIRVGVTIAKTLAWTLSKALYQVNNLKALSLQGDSDKLIISVIYDKDSASYIGIYDSVITEDYLSIENVPTFEAKDIQIISDTVNDYVIALEKRLNINNNVEIKTLDEDFDYLKVIDYALENGKINPHSAKPIYLKKIDVEKR